MNDPHNSTRPCVDPNCTVCVVKETAPEAVIRVPREVADKSEDAAKDWARRFNEAGVPKAPEQGLRPGGMLRSREATERAPDSVWLRVPVGPGCTVTLFVTREPSSRELESLAKFLRVAIDDPTRQP